MTAASWDKHHDTRIVNFAGVNVYITLRPGNKMLIHTWEAFGAASEPMTEVQINLDLMRQEDTDW
jgi:hypothetical protein